MSLKTKISALLFFLALASPNFAPADMSTIESVIDTLPKAISESMSFSSTDAETDKPAKFFEEKLSEIKNINKDDLSVKNVSDTIKLFSQRSYQPCVEKSENGINKYGQDSVFFVFEFSFGVKCLSEVYEHNKASNKTLKQWSSIYKSIDFQNITKNFHGAENDLFADHVLKLSEILFLDMKNLSFSSEQIATMADQLQKSKNKKVKKELFLYFLNKNDQKSAKEFLTRSDPDLLEISTLESLQEYFKDEVYEARINEIKKSKTESQELKKLYQKNKYSDFLDLIKKSNLVLDSEVSLASRQLGWLYVRGKDDFKEKVVQSFETLNIDPHQFFWVLSNQGLFKDMTSNFNKLELKKKKHHMTMGLKAYIYSGKYEDGYKFIKEHKIVENYESYSHSVLFYSSLLLLRFNKDKEALVLLNHLIARDSDYKLQAMYAKYNIYKDLKKSEYKSVAKDLINYYPLTFYGLLVAHNENLTSLLPFMESKPLPILGFNFDREEEKRKLKHLVFIFDNNLESRFRKTVEATLSALSFESQIIWAYRFKIEDQPLSAIKIMNQVWTSRRDLIHPSIIPLAYPKDYLSDVKKHSVPGIDPFLVLGLIRQESAFQKNATSASSARGLMQLLTATAKDMARSLRLSKVSLPWGLYSPEVNIRLGSYYLRKRIEAYKGHVPLALASYNVGPGRLQKWSLDRNTIVEAQENIQSDSWKMQDLWVEEMPWEETRFYVKAVLRNYLLYFIFEDYKPLKSCFRVWNCESKNELENTAKENIAPERTKSI
jgi:hypothetical protein